MPNKKPPTSTKRIQIDKNNATMVIILAIMAFITVFSMFACKALLNQRSFQARVIEQKKKSLSQIKTNNAEAVKLLASYQTLISSPDNIIGGSSTGSGDKDGDNARIILDALPSKYDFPALATSLDKILSGKPFKVVDFTGTDDEIAQSAPTNTTTQPVEMPVKISITGNFDSIQSFVDTLNQSIRPIKLTKLNVTGSDASLKINVEAKTYYQPETSIRKTTKVIK